MKNTSFIFILLLLFSCTNEKTSKNKLEQSKDTLETVNVVQKEIYQGKLVLKLPQDSSCCTPVDELGGIRGVVGFALMDSNRIAILCETDRVIKIYEMNSNKFLKEIKLVHPFRNIGYSNLTSSFYMSNRNKLYEYSYQFDSMRVTDINKMIGLIHEFNMLDSNIYGKTSKGNFLLVQNGNPITVENQLNNSIKDIIVNSKTFVNYTKRISSFEVNEYSSDTSVKYFINTKEESSFFKFIASLDNEFIFVKYLNQGKEKGIIGNYMSISKEDKSISIYSELPNIHYTSTLNTMQVCNKKLYHLISTPYSILVFEIALDKLDKFSYPDSLNYKCI